MPLDLTRALALTLMAVSGTLTGCDSPPPATGGSEDRPAGRGTDTTDHTATDSATDLSADTARTAADTTSDSLAPADAPVRVWFLSGEALVPVARPGEEATVRSALESLVAGPTAEERGRGLSSWFGEPTRDVVSDVRVEGDRVVVDFRESLPTLIPGAGSSAGSEVLLAALDSTVFQFPAVDAVEYRLAGSCEAFWEWLQRECVVVRR